MATLAIDESRASMKVASVTVMAMAHGLARGRHRSWKVGVATAAAAKGTPVCCGISRDPGRGLLSDYRNIWLPDIWVPHISILRCGRKLPHKSVPQEISIEILSNPHLERAQ